MRGIVFSLESDAERVLEKLNVRKLTVERDIYYRIAPGSVGDPTILATVSGLGKLNAAIATFKLIQMGCSEVTHIGTALSPGGKFLPFEIVEPTVFFDGDFSLSEIGLITKDPCYVNTNFDVSPYVPCYTCSDLANTAKIYDGLTDMEAYGIASVCGVFGVPFKCVKVVESDLMGMESEECLANSASLLLPYVYGEDLDVSSLDAEEDVDSVVGSD